MKDLFFLDPNRWRNSRREKTISLIEDLLHERAEAMFELEQELSTGRFGVWVEFADGNVELINIKHLTVAKV